MSTEEFDDRMQRIQDRMRASGDDEAAEAIDELYGLWYAEQEKNTKTPVKKRWQEDPLRYIWSGGKKMRKTGAMTAALARAKGHITGHG